MELERLVKDCWMFRFIERSMYDIKCLMYYYPMVQGFHRTFDKIIERLIKAHRTFYKSIERLILSDMHID
jgi:hypothetical protein